MSNHVLDFASVSGSSHVVYIHNHANWSTNIPLETTDQQFGHVI